jgi:hypothetical protein
MSIKNVPNMPPKKEVFVSWNVKDTLPADYQTAMSQHCMGTNGWGGTITFHQDGVFTNYTEIAISDLTNKWAPFQPFYIRSILM